MGKKTGWVIAATEGATIDGRIISANWINDMAEQYSTEEYTALIWPEHHRSTWSKFGGDNWGIVDEVKAEKYKGKLRLYVKLTANDYLLEANKDGQKLFMSIEPEPDYQGNGRCYLIGLAVTDSPASTGTTRLKFSVGKNQHEHEYSQLEELNHSDFIYTIPEDNGHDDALNQEKSLFALLRQFFTKPTPTTIPNATPEDEEPMDKQQFAALVGKMDTLANKFGELETKVNNFGVKPVDDPAPEPESEQKPEPLAAVSTEEFNALKTELEDMKTKFAALSQEVPGQEPNPAGNGESINLV